LYSSSTIHVKNHEIEIEKHSRLSTTNTSLNTQLSELAAKSNLSTSSSAPLQYEIARLKSELEALNSHSKWLETELSTRTSQSSSLKSTHAKIVQDLTQKFNESTANEEKAKSDLSLLKLRLKSNTQRMENLEKQILEKDKYHADIIHELKVEIQTERNLVALKKENIMRVEDRYNDAVREIDTMKALAAAAKKDHEEEIVAIKGEIENHVGKALEENNAENEKKIKEIRNEMEKIVVEKVKLEDMMMSSGSQGTLAIGDGTGNTRQQPSLLTYGKAEGGNSGDVTGSEPISLIKLYDKLADKEQELRRETAERRKVELYLERIHQDFERRMPKQQQQRREYELAMSQMGDMQNRIQDALQEAQMARDELNQKERESRQTDVECQELRLENSDLAKQVQLLLKKSMGNGDLAGEIQAQNQQLLKEHHRASARVNELEQKLESDSVQLKLREALSSLKDLEEERENQATLVASIVQQRDLYRALLAKNDTQILAAAGDQGSTAIVAAKDQIERYTEVESKNRELADTISKLNADLLSATNAKQGLEERLQRLDVHATDLSQNTNKLQNELLVAHAATARSQAEASFQLQKVTRLEDSLESSRNDLNRINENRKELQRLNGELQSIIAERENAQVKIEENLRQTEVQLRLSEAKAQSLQAAESRLNTENNSLRSELSRHIALQESMQKLEVGLSAQSSEERDRLVEEVKRLTNELTTTKNQSSLEIEKLQNQLDNANTKVEEIRKIQQESLEEVIKAKNDAMNAQSELQQMTDKHALVEKNLNAAKIKLGDIDVDLSEQDKVETLTAEVNRLKEELIAANKKAEDYQKMTKASEVTLAESTNASLEYKKNTENELKKVREELESAKRNATAKQEALEGLAEDISKSRGEQEKATDGLKVKVETLKAEIATAKSDRDSWKSQVDELSKEIQVHQADVKAAKVRT
jgi:nucleoprotein TPR